MPPLDSPAQLIYSEKDTQKVATDFAKTLESGDLVLLEGPMGVGKSTFVAM